MSAVRILRQQIPFARSILWAPTSAARPAGDMPFPVFLKQSALQAVYEHLATIPPPGQGILGFLLGDRCECPVTGVSYSVIDAALRLNQTIYGDRSRDVITRLWQRLEGQLEAQEAHLIGWYHTHAPAPLEMSVHDVETHEQYFGEPWQVGIIVGTDAEKPAGAFFRAGNDATWVRAPQPFYELLNEDSVRPDGKKRSFMTWKTYRAYNPPGLQPRAGTSAATETRAVPPPRPPQPVDEREDEPEEPGREEPAGLEHMPQAELEEPRRTELDEPASPEPDPEEAGEVEETAGAKEPEEWEDPGALRFLSAADDMPPPPPAAPAPAAAAPPPPHYRPPAPAPAAFATQDTSEQEVEDQVEEQFEEEIVEVEAEAEVEEQPPVRRPKRRRSPGRVRRLIRKLVRVVAFGLAGLAIVGGGILAWPYVPALLQRVRAFVPSRQPAARRSPAPAPAAGPRAAPVAAPPPAVARPARTPRPEFALLDQAGDSLERALQAYNGRMRLFEARKLDCPVLGRGMLRVGRAVTSYGMQRNATRVTLDPERLTRDRDLRAGVDSAGREFQRSQCARG